MPRLMSVTLTEQAVRDRTKTVTRRLGWWTDKNGRRLLQVGDQLTLCPKVMGRKPGEPLERIVTVEVVDIRRERIDDMHDGDVPLEGVPVIHGRFSAIYLDGPLAGWPPAFAWREWFCEEMDVTPSTMITRIEWAYPEEPQPGGGQRDIFGGEQ